MLHGIIARKPLNTKSFNYGVGAGVRITTPIGPVKLDYGVGKHKNKFHFSFGTQF